MNTANDNLSLSMEIARFVAWAQAVPANDSLFGAPGFDQWRDLIDAHTDECMAAMERNADELMAEAQALRAEANRRAGERTS